MKILFWGDSPTAATGLGNVSKNLLNYLYSKGHEITVIGVNDRGGWKDPKLYPYKIYPAIYNNYLDIWGALRLINVFEGKDPEIKEEFDVFLTNLDFFLFKELKIDGKPLLHYLLPFKNKIKKIIYTPIDNDIIFGRWREIFFFFDKIYVPSFYSQRVLKDYNIKSEVVYYPLDKENFYPEIPKDKPKDKFIIGYVGRNQWRKDLFSLIYIFHLFKQRHPEAFLYLHTKPDDKEQEGWNILEILKHYIYFYGKDYYVPLDLNVVKGIERENMRKVYNYFDVFLSTSTGEGFGLPYAEALLCEVPVIIPNNSVAIDFKEFAYVYKVTRPHSFGWTDYNRIRYLADIEEAVEKLEYVYNHREEAKKRAKKGREFFMNYKFKFDL